MNDDELPVVPASALDEVDRTKQWLVDQLWPRAGVGIIGGPPKSCKSWLGLDLALSVTSGTPCLGTFSVIERAGALIYLAEDAGSIVKERLLGLCRHRALDLADLPLGVITASAIRLDLERDQRRLTETVRRHTPRLLLLDPFVRLHRIDENHAGDVSALLGFLRELQRQHDLAVVVVHHARKNGGPANGGLSLRGSGDFFAWVDTALCLRRQRQQILLSVEHRAASAPPLLKLKLTAHEDSVRLEVESADDQDTIAAPAQLDLAVLRALADAPDRALTRSALREILHVRNERLVDALARLAAAGSVSRRGDAWAAAVPVPSL